MLPFNKLDLHSYKHRNTERGQCLMEWFLHRGRVHCTSVKSPSFPMLSVPLLTQPSPSGSLEILLTGNIPPSPALFRRTFHFKLLIATRLFSEDNASPTVSSRKIHMFSHILCIFTMDIPQAQIQHVPSWIYPTPPSPPHATPVISYLCFNW